MRRRYHLTFTFKKTLEEAMTFCYLYNSKLTPYEKRAGYVAHFHDTPWLSKDGNDRRYTCCHYYKA